MNIFLPILAVLSLKLGCSYNENDTKNRPESKEEENQLTCITDCAASPAPDEELAIPEITLSRIYWKVYRESGEKDKCYFKPRPDNVEAARRACSDKNHSQHSIFLQYHLCKSDPVPKIINNIPCDSAKNIAQELHSNLSFSKKGPYLYEEDRALSCEVKSCDSNSKLNNYCRYYKELYQKTLKGEAINENTRIDSEEELELISECTNEIYNIN